MPKQDQLITPDLDPEVVDADVVPDEVPPTPPELEKPVLVFGVPGKGDQILARVCKRIGIRPQDFLEEAKARGWYNAAPCSPQVGDIIALEYSSLGSYWYGEVTRLFDRHYRMGISMPFTAEVTTLEERDADAGLRDVAKGLDWNDVWKVRAFIRIPEFLSN